MQFQRIDSAGGAAADVDPRTTPQSVQDKSILRIPDTVPGTDTAPKTLALALEGTSAQTMTVQLWVLDDPMAQQIVGNQDDLTAERAARRYYKYGDALTLTVGQVHLLTAVAGASTAVQAPCPVGRVYFQVTTRPAANAVLKVGALGG